MKNCRLCGSSQLSLKNKLPYFKVLKCDSCDVCFADKFPVEKKIKGIYTKKYYAAWTDDTGEIPRSVESMKKSTFDAYLKLLSKYINLRNIRFLDVGCATGFLLEEAKEMGCDCWGVELNPFGVKESLKKFPGRIYHGILESSKYEKGFFDAITMIDLIEHTQDPFKVLNEVKRITKNGGYVMMVTPNIGGIWAKILGNRWTNYKEEHLYYFSEKSLRFLIEKCGLTFVYGEVVSKTLTLRYICSQLEIYKTPVLTWLTRFFKYLPGSILDFTFPIRTGDYLAIARK